MNLAATHPGENQARRRGILAMTLIEVIGILAVLAVLSAMLLPALVRQIDKLVSDQEVATLQSFGNALPRSIMRNRYIPGPTDWTNNIAAELGMNAHDVALNARHIPRFFVIDPSFQVGTNGSGLPYAQTKWPFGSMVTDTNTSQIIAPISPRVMVLSSLGMNLPATLASPVSTGDFTTIWNWDDTSSTLPSASAFTGWGGKAEDLKIQRINLTSIFVHLLLSTYPSATLGYFSIDTANPNPFFPSPIFEGYFIQSSVLGLYLKQGSTTNLDSQQILFRDNSFVCDAGVWRGSILGGSMPAGIDMAGAVDQFVSAPTNTAVGASIQTQVVQAMTNYMGAYTVWAANGFAKDLTYVAVSNSQVAMTNFVIHLFNPTPPVVNCPP